NQLNDSASSKSFEKKMNTPPSTFEILRRLLVHSDGRDKALKIIQYFGKIILWIRDPKVSKVNYYIFYLCYRKKSFPRLKAMTSQFGTTRKIIRLAHFLEPFLNLLEHFTGARNIPCLGVFNTSANLVNDIFN
ncbi:8127_t:CDS:1, partial [Racocetra persica]